MLDSANGLIARRVCIDAKINRLLKTKRSPYTTVSIAVSIAVSLFGVASPV